MNGPTVRAAKGVDDFYGPEINSIPVALPQFPGCSPVPFADPAPDDGWTNSFEDIKCYDSLHVQAVINQIDGFTHDRARTKVGVPGAVRHELSGGQRRREARGRPRDRGSRAAYTDVLGTPGQGAGRASLSSSINPSGGS